jgi:hypothetical protein
MRVGFIVGLWLGASLVSLGGPLAYSLHQPGPVEPFVRILTFIGILIFSVPLLILGIHAFNIAVYDRWTSVDDEMREFVLWAEGSPEPMTRTCFVK